MGKQAVNLVRRAFSMRGLRQLCLALFVATCFFLAFSHWIVFSLDSGVGIEMGTYSFGIYFHNTDSSPIYSPRVRMDRSGQDPWGLDSFGFYGFVFFKRLFPHSDEYVIGVPWWLFALVFGSLYLLARRIDGRKTKQNNFPVLFTPPSG
jgi:hypothetical protein